MESGEEALEERALLLLMTEAVVASLMGAAGLLGLVVVAMSPAGSWDASSKTLGEWVGV